MAAPTAAEPTFAELFTPKLVTVLREGYGLRHLKADALAGLTVAIVALPLSMAIAIASGLTPDRGLYASIVGGFLVSALGGSRFQIGGPAGAFIVLVAAAVEQHGVDGVILATAMSGLMLFAVGFLRLGTFIKYIPYPVTIGFTAGIAVIIFASQLKELLGLALPREPGPLLPKLAAIAEALPTLQPLGAGGGGPLPGPHPGPAPVAAAMAGLHHRGGLGRDGDGLAWLASGDDRHALRRHPLLAAGAASARHLGGEARGAAADRALLRAARRHREPALGGGGGLHEWAAAPL